MENLVLALTDCLAACLIGLYGTSDRQVLTGRSACMWISLTHQSDRASAMRDSRFLFSQSG